MVCVAKECPSFIIFSGNTPLHSSAIWNTSQITELLLQKGAKMNAQNASGATALHVCSIISVNTDSQQLASSKGFVDVVAVLLANSAGMMIVMYYADIYSNCHQRSQRPYSST